MTTWIALLAVSVFSLLLVAYNLAWDSFKTGKGFVELGAPPGWPQ